MEQEIETSEVKPAPTIPPPPPPVVEPPVLPLPVEAPRRGLIPGKKFQLTRKTVAVETGPNSKNQTLKLNRNTNVENVPTTSTGAMNIREEMLEGENAVKAVEDYERGLAEMPSNTENTDEEGINKEIPAAPVEEKADCPQLYDPCTKEPIESIELLEKRVRELKRTADTVAVGLYGLTNETSNYDFLTGVFLNPKVSLDDMVSFRLSSGGQIGSDIFEVLSRLFVFLGGMETVNPRDGGNFKFMQKIEGGNPHIYGNSKEAFQQMKCKATRAMGISDITLVRTSIDTKEIKPTDPYCEVECDTKVTEEVKTYLMSVKWYRKEKSAEHYDLEKLYVAANKITSLEQKPVDLIVFLRSKKDFEIAHNRAFRQYTKELAKTFFGWNEDVKPFLEGIRRLVFETAGIRGIPVKDALEQQYFIPNAKPSLSLQLHQDIIVKGICNSIETSEDKLYLVGVLPRGGKTYIAGGIMREYIKRTGIQNLNIFWITAAPNETLPQVRDDLLNKFEDFASFEFFEVRKLSDIKKTKPYSVFFCSSQLLLLSKQDIKKREYLQSLLTGQDKLGLVFFDEAHKTGTGEQTKKEIKSIIDTYSTYQLPFIFLTATYYSILLDYNIQKTNIFIWDYTDVLKTRALATESEQDDALTNLRNRFNTELVDSILQKRISNGESLESMAKAYTDYPDLYFVSADFQEEALQRFSEQGLYYPDSGFSLSSIFAIKSDVTLADIKTEDNKIRKDAYKIFVNLQNPINIINLITPKPEFIEGDFVAPEPLRKEAGSILEPTLLGRINAMSSDAKSRFRLDERPSMLMFMPTGNIFYLLCAWASLLLKEKWWSQNYEIACVIDDKTLDAEMTTVLVGMKLGEIGLSTVHIIKDNPKANLLALERKLHCSETPKGLLILAGEKLSMGISLPCTDIVFLFNEKKSPDDIIQKMYRALTPSTGKNAAFVIDLNPVRTLAAVYGYTRASNQNLNTSSEILEVIYDTYSWDSDYFDFSLRKGPDARPLTFMDKLRDMLDKAEKDTTNEYRLNEDIGGFEKKVGENIKRGMNTSFVEKLAGHFSSKSSKSILSSLGLTDNARITLESGKLIIREKKEKALDDPASGHEDEDTILIVIDNFIETLNDFIKYLALTSKASTLEGALKEYEGGITNEEGSSLQKNVLSLVKARTDIKGNDPSVLSKLLLVAVKNFAYQSSESVFRQMRGKVDEPSIRKDAVLKIIHKHLTPKKKAKDEKGEVFTPVEIIEKMLSKLPAPIWKRPDIKILDPANGIGNFPVVAFYLLDKGLSTVEGYTNEKVRRKHIVNNMLYMIEYQSNNTRIAKNLFEKLCEGCKPNIWTVDTLSLDAAKLKSKGWPEKYHIIMGNPPYNTGGILKGGGAPWPKFVKLAFELIEPGGYITMIHPPGWRKFYDPEERENQGSIWHSIREKGWNLDYINVSDMPPKHFPIVDYYLVHAKKGDGLTNYDSEFMSIKNSGEAELKYPFIPNMLNTEVLNILKKIFNAEGEKINIVRNQSFKPTVADKNKSGISHYHFTSRTGDKQIYKKTYDTVPEYINKNKVIMTYSGGYEKGRLLAFYSEDKIGTTANSMYMIADSKTQGDKLVSFFNSDIITFLMKITQYSASPNHKNEFKILNSLKIPSSLSEYKLTPKEEELIKKVVGTKEVAPQEAGARRFTQKIRR